MRENVGQWYAVDSESFANGKVRDVTVIYDYEDIFDALLDHLMMEPEPDVSDTIYLGENEVEVGEFLSENDLRSLEEELNFKLLDDDFGGPKHDDVVVEFLEANLDEDVEMEFDGQEFR